MRPARVPWGAGWDDPGVRTLVASDLHLGSGASADLLQRADIREPLLREVEQSDEVILLGDVIELRDRPLAEALALARPFFAEVASALGRGRIVLVPGNHDHHLLDHWFADRRLLGSEPLGLEHRVAADAGPLAQLSPRGRRTVLEIAYPGIWLRPGVYATHGHYLDRHLTIPTFERLGVAAVERLLGMPRFVGEDALAPPDEPQETVTPDEYERAQAPVYAFLFALAQAGTAEERLGGGPSARVWQALGGGSGRSGGLRGRLLGTVALPGAVRVANRLGLGPVESDLSPGAITRAGIAAMAEVIRRLGIEADHVIFGHTHRRGPLGEESGWMLPAGTRLWNTGSWVYAPSLLGRTARESAYWPGTVGVVDAGGAIELRHLLDDHSRSELRGAGEDDSAA
jgi:predicted phosphodiesterase